MKQRKRLTLTFPKLLASIPFHPKRQLRIQSPRREKHHTLLHREEPLLLVPLQPLPDRKRQLFKLHLQQIALVSMVIDPVPRSRIMLPMVKYFKLRSEILEIGIHFSEIVNVGGVGGRSPAVSCVRDI